jgi:catechol 2,3-dioxygenase-like lactoylglutathione lyase family enzyme
MEKRVSVITLGVRDLARSRRFYESGLGWGRDSGGDDIVFYQAGGFIVALYEWPKLAEDAGVEQEGSGFPSGVATTAISPTRTGTSGRSPGTQAGPLRIGATPC